MVRAASLAILLALAFGQPSAFAVELGLAESPGDAAAGDGDFASTLRGLTRELGRWERERLGHQEPSLSIEIDRKAPYRLSLTEKDGGLHIVAGRAFVRDPALFRTFAGFVLGLSRYDRYGQEKWIDRLGLRPAARRARSRAAWSSGSSAGWPS